MKRVLNISLLIATIGLLGSVTLLGCDTNDTSEPDPSTEVAEIVMVPDSVQILVGEQVDFSLVALNAAGDTLDDPDLTVTWWSRDEDVFTVENNGLATAQDSGSAWCIAEATDLAKSASSLRFTGRDSAFVQVFLF